MVEIVANRRQFTVLGVDGVIVPDVTETVGLCVFPDPSIQFAPICAVVLAVNLPVQAVKLRMLLVDPIEDATLVVAAKVQILQPYQVALALDPVDDGRDIRNARKDGRNEAGGLNAGLVELTHSLQAAFYAHTVIHLLVEGLVQRIDGPADTGTGERLDEVQVTKDKVALGGDAQPDAGALQLLQDHPGPFVFGFMRLIGIGDGAEEGFLASELPTVLDGGPVLHVEELSPGLRMIGESLHERGIAVFAGVQAPDIGIHGKVRNRQVRLRHDFLDLYFFDDHFRRCFLLVALLLRAFFPLNVPSLRGNCYSDSG